MNPSILRTRVRQQDSLDMRYSNPLDHIAPHYPTLILIVAKEERVRISCVADSQRKSKSHSLRLTEIPTGFSDSISCQDPRFSF